MPRRHGTPVLYANVHFRLAAPKGPTAAGSGQEAVVDLRGHAVALARRALEAWPVDDGDPPPRELDETGPLQDACSHGHRRPPHPEHLGEELVRHRKLVGSH